MQFFPQVFILILNYRGTDDTLACLDSLRVLDYPNRQIVVIDNDSPDDSAARLQVRLDANPGEFHFIRSPDNLGFSGGNNLGIRYAIEQTPHDAEAYIWLLNNDTTVAPDALRHLVSEAHKTGGLTGSLLLYPDNSYQQVGTRVNWWSGSTKGYPESTVRADMPVETLSGASMLIPLVAFRQFGLMDAAYFLYFEDGELSLRMASNGFPLTVAAQSKVFHKEGATTGRKSLRTQYYFHRNRLRMLFQFANPLQKLSIGLYAAFRMLRSIVKSAMSSDPQRKIETRVQWLAVRDFLLGVSGPCPHNLDALR